MPLIPFTVGAVIGVAMIYLLKKNKSTETKQKIQKDKK